MRSPWCLTIGGVVFLAILIASAAAVLIIWGVMFWVLRAQTSRSRAITYAAAYALMVALLWVAYAIWISLP